jgi:predicted nucleotidyltransferase
MPAATENDLAARLAAFCADKPIRRMELFGSRQRGTARRDSDVDLLVTYDEGVPLGWDFFPFVQGLRDQLESSLGLTIDLVSRRAVENTANPIVRQSILIGTEIVYERSA